MNVFRFSLEKVLELRKYREQEAEIELGRAIGILTEIEQRLTANAEHRSGAAAERFSPKNDALTMLSYENYIRRLDQQREQLLEAAAQAELVVEEKRNLFLAASRERKVLDKLREKREKEYRKKMFAEETKILDDISGGVLARARISGGEG
jgi:flagellar FliJ protein